MEEWKEYFMGLLGGVEGKVVLEGGSGKGEGKNREVDEEEGISRREIKESVSRLKEGKAMGLDGIPGETWRYGGEEEENGFESFATRCGGDRDSQRGRRKG